MKTYHLIENLDDTYGGPAQSVSYLAKNLEKLEIENSLLSIKYHNNESNEVIQSSGLNWVVFSFDYVKKIRYSKALKEYLIDIIKRDKDILLHTHNLWNYIPYLAYSLVKKYEVKLVASLRGSVGLDKFQKKLAWRLFQKDMLQSSNVIHITKEEDVKILRDMGITSPIALIPNGVNLDEFQNMIDKDTAKGNLGLQKHKNYILFLSRVHPYKGLVYLVRSWIKFAKRYSDWDLLIAGPIYDKNYYKEIENEITKNNLQNRVHFKGMVRGEKRIDCFAASDLFVLPSHTENFGIAIAEAMVAKLPVITTHGAPWKEIEVYDAGWWVELTQNNIDSALHMALSLDKKNLAEKGINGFELIKKYDWKHQASKMKEVYDWISYDRVKPEFIYEYRDKSF